jgi:BirA family biotin operon repressor/biotin-[acetyl-CoA-carboxylase] ligase
VSGTCLDDQAGETVDRELLLGALLAALGPRRSLLATPDGRRQVAAELRRRCATLGRTIRVELAAESISGVASEIDDAGRLVVQTATGLRTVSAGDVIHLRPV